MSRDVARCHAMSRDVTRCRAMLRDKNFIVRVNGPLKSYLTFFAHLDRVPAKNFYNFSAKQRKLFVIGLSQNTFRKRKVFFPKAAKKFFNEKQ
jgi:hypothetical protein